jgi:hypothetical protein
MILSTGCFHLTGCFGVASETRCAPFSLRLIVDRWCQVKFSTAKGMRAHARDVVALTTRQGVRGGGSGGGTVGTGDVCAVVINLQAILHSCNGIGTKEATVGRGWQALPHLAVVVDSQPCGGSSSSNEDCGQGMWEVVLLVQLLVASPMVQQCDVNLTYLPPALLPPPLLLLLPDRWKWTMLQSG